MASVRPVFSEKGQSMKVRGQYRGPGRESGWVAWLTPHQRSYNNLSVLLFCLCMRHFSKHFPFSESDLTSWLCFFHSTVWDSTRPHIPSCSFGCITNGMLKSNPNTGDSSPCFLWDLACQFVLGPVPHQQLCICHMSDGALMLPLQQKPMPALNNKGMHMIDGRHL